MAAPSRLILVGRVGGAFGVRGEVRIATYSEDPMSLYAWRELKGENGQPILTLAQARLVKGGLVARCAGVDTRDKAEALRGLKLYVARDRLPEPDPDEFYLADLIGLEARDAEGRALGRVRDAPNFGAGDLLEIDPGEGRASWYCPFTRETAPEVQIAEGWLTLIAPPEAEDESGRGEDEEIGEPGPSGPASDD